MRAILTISLVLVGAATGGAQQLNRHAVTESYDPASPEVPGVSAADVVVVNTTMVGGGGVQWTAAQMGLPAGANVDAFSDGTDVLPPFPPVECRELWVEYSVDRDSVGVGGVGVAVSAAGNGAAGDTFTLLTFLGGGATLFHSSDALGVTSKFGGPVETDVDALAWAERAAWPVYFSVDGPTALLLGVSPADVLTSAGNGTFSVFRTATSLGLSAADDVDALAVDAAGEVVLSVTRASPTNVSGPFAGAAAAGLLRSGGVLSQYVTPAKLFLAATDELDGVRVTDVANDFALDSSFSPTDEALRIDGSGGNARHVVDVPLGQAFWFTMQPSFPSPYVCFYSFGRPCICNQLDTNGVATLSIGGFLPGCPGGAPLFGPLLFAQGPLSLPAVLNFPVEVTLQAVTGTAFVEGTTNAVTLRVR